MNELDQGLLEVRNEKQYLDIAGVVLLTLDRNGNITLLNKKGHEILEYEEGELLGKNWFDTCLPEHNREEVKKVFGTIMRGLVESEEFHENTIITKNGTEKLIAWHNTLLHDENGNIIGTLSSGENITARKKTEQKLRESEEKYRNIFEKSSNAIILLDLTGKIIECNSVTERIFGYSIKELIGQNYLDLPFYSEDNVHTLKERFQNITKKHDLEPLELKIKKKDGNISIIKSSISFIKVGEQDYFQAIIQDITKKKKAEQSLRESEEKLSKAFQSSPHLMSIVSLNEGRFINANDAFKQVLGYDIDELIGKTTSELNIWANPEQRREMVRILKEQGRIKNFEAEAVTKSGERLLMLLSAEIINLNNEPYLISTTIDISEHRKAEQKLRESEEKFRTIAEETEIGVAILQDNKVKYANKAIDLILGYTFDIRRNWTCNDYRSLLNSQDYNLFLSLIDNFINGNIKSIESFPFKIKTGKGDEKWIEISAKPIMYQEKHAILITIIDISDKKQTEQELREVSNLKSELIKRTSHELNTPLISIKGFADLLLDLHADKFDDEVLSILKEINEGANRLALIVNNLLKTSQLKSNGISIKKTKQNLSFLINFCVNELQGLAKARNLKIIVDIAENINVEIIKEDIYKVISHLIINAIKYTPPNGLIKVKSSIEEGYYIISVEDNGIGITIDESKQLFRRFGKIERYGKEWDVGIDGLGLGLYNSKKIIKLHGGKMWAESHGRNKGSKFFFTLPILKTQESPVLKKN
ncbi:MAG: PAS domain S-box protein [Promethearchaeota archaeon]